jgi:hypothetical protein
MKRAKKPPSTTSKGTSQGTFSSCQGDDYYDEVCVFEGFKETKAFLPKVVATINSFLRVLKRKMKISLFKKQNWKNCSLSYKPLHKLQKKGC